MSCPVCLPLCSGATLDPAKHLVDPNLSHVEFYSAYPGLVAGAVTGDGTEEGAKVQKLLQIVLQCMWRIPARRPSFTELAEKLSQFCDSLGPEAALAAAAANAASRAAAEACRQSAPREVMADGTAYGDLMRQLVSLPREEVHARLRSLGVDERKGQCMLQHMYSLRTPQQREQWDQVERMWEEQRQAGLALETLVKQLAVQMLQLQDQQQRCWAAQQWAAQQWQQQCLAEEVLRLQVRMVQEAFEGQQQQQQPYAGLLAPQWQVQW